MNVILAVSYTGTADADDALAARHAVFIENQEIAARNAANGTSVPLLLFSTPAELKASYLLVLAQKVTSRHLAAIADAKSGYGMELRFTTAQIASINANLVARLNAGQLPADIVTDTAA